MTQTQIGYQQVVETKRHDLATEDLGRDSLKETSRHNRATERLGTDDLKERTRHNKASERLGTRELAEQKRSNKAREKETKRANKAREAETHRSNVANENISRYRAKTERDLALSNIARNATSIKYMEKQISMYDLELLLKSDNKIASTTGTAILAADWLADPKMNPEIKEFIRKTIGLAESEKKQKVSFVDKSGTKWTFTMKGGPNSSRGMDPDWYIAREKKNSKGTHRSSTSGRKHGGGGGSIEGKGQPTKQTKYIFNK
jgi:hypothetical protein